MISVHNVSMRYGSKVLFEEVTTTFSPGRRFGLTPRQCGPGMKRCCIGCWLFFRRAQRQSTSAFGLGGNSRKQSIDFGVIQPLQRYG